MKTPVLGAALMASSIFVGCGAAPSPSAHASSLDAARVLHELRPSAERSESAASNAHTFAPALTRDALRHR